MHPLLPFHVVCGLNIVTANQVENNLSEQVETKRLISRVTIMNLNKSSDIILVCRYNRIYKSSHSYESVQVERHHFGDNYESEQLERNRFFVLSVSK